MYPIESGLAMVCNCLLDRPPGDTSRYNIRKEERIVGNVPVSCKKMPLLALEYEPPETKSFKTIEASVRIDAVASAGYKISRSKLVDLIGKGDVRVNWTTVTKNGTTVKAGDMVSVSGMGRLKIGEINTTKKGKFAIELIRYL